MTGARGVPHTDQRSITDVRIASGSVAALIGAKFAANDEFRKEFKTAAYATEVVKVSPLKLLLSTFSIYGLEHDNYGLVKDIDKSRIFDEMPHPKAVITKDSDYWKKNGKVLKEDENRYAEYPKGDTKYEWYKTWFYAIPEGKFIADEIDEWTLAREAKGKTPSGRYANQPQSEIINKLALWKLRETSGIKFIKMAIEAVYQWRDILVDMHGKVGVQFEMLEQGTDKARISEGFTTIRVYDAVTKGSGLSWPFSISGFNNLDIEVALEKGGTFVNLRDSTKSGARETDDSGLWDEGNIMISGVLDNLPQLADWFAIPQNTGELMAKCDAKDKATRERTEEAENTILAGMKWYHAMSRFAAKYAAIAMDIEAKRAEEHRAASDAVQAKIKSVA